MSNKRSLVIRICAVLVLILIAACMMVVGRGHTVYLDNKSIEYDGRTYEATLVGSDIFTDVAVLKIEADGLTALPIGDSSKVRVGEFVLAIGDPISADELSGSVTFGILSALSRQINIEGFVN